MTVRTDNRYLTEQNKSMTVYVKASKLGKIDSLRNIEYKYKTVDKKTTRPHLIFIYLAKAL